MAFNKAKALVAADKFIAKQNYPKALNELLKIAKVSSNDANLLNKIGDLYIKTGHTGNATAYFLKVADSYQKTGFNLKAVAVLKKIIRIDTQNLDARDQLVNLLLMQGHQSEAKGELRRIAEHYYSENLFSRALTCYEKMLEIDPNNIEARLKITEILVREGRRSEAATHFSQMGRELLEKNMIHEAQKMAGQGLKMDPDNIKLQTLSAQILLAGGKSDEALHQLTEICRRNDKDLDAIKILGHTYLDRDQLREAKACFLRAMHISNQETATLEDIARRFIDRGELDEAHLTMVPICEALASRGEFDEAVRLFRGILYTDENHLASLETLVNIYRQAGQNANCILTLEKIITFYLEENEKDRAIQHIRSLLELDPNNLEWRSRLESLDDDMFEGDEEESQPVAHYRPPASSPPAPKPEPSDSKNPFAESGDYQVFEEIPLSPGVEETITGPVGARPISLEPDDLATRIANHLTEAEVFLKYGILDQALSHLTDVVELDAYHVEANTKLKQLYFEKNEVERALACIEKIITGCIERGEYLKAGEYLPEMQDYRPDIAAKYNQQLKQLINKDDNQNGDESAKFNFDLVEGNTNPGEESLFFDHSGASEIMDFSQIAEPRESFDQPRASEDGWSLDMPQKDLNSAHDLRDIFKEGVADTGQIQSFDFPSFSDSGEFEGEAEDDDLGEASNQEIADHVLNEIGPSPFKQISALGELEAPAVPDPPKPAGTRSLTSELEEIDFFISVEAFDDARTLLLDAHQRYGQHPLVMERIQEVDAYTTQISAKRVTQNLDRALDESSELLEKDSGFFDLAAELSEELFDDSAEVNDKTGQEEIQSVEELFEEFKRGVEEQIDEGDFETHYDLGIAYKEMGLLEEAINEFRKASVDRERLLECHSLIGNCLIELGRTEDAIQHFCESLDRHDLSQIEVIALRYELALAYQGLGELEVALKNFREIQKLDANYRDLEARIGALV